MDVSTKRAVGTGLMSLWAWRVSKQRCRAQKGCTCMPRYAREGFWTDGDLAMSFGLDAVNLARSVNYSQSVLRYYRCAISSTHRRAIIITWYDENYMYSIATRFPFFFFSFFCSARQAQTIHHISIPQAASRREKDKQDAVLLDQCETGCSQRSPPKASTPSPDRPSPAASKAAGVPPPQSRAPIIGHRCLSVRW